MKISKKYFCELIFSEKECIDFLEEKARLGYQLDKIGIFYIYFKPCRHPLKYQLDYTPITDEYLQVIQQLGYKHMGTFYENIHVYASEDLNAPSLQSDEQLHQHLLLERFKKSSIISSLLTGILLFLIAQFIWNHIPLKNIGTFYTSYKMYFLMFLAIVLSFYLIGSGLLLYFKRKSLLKRNYCFAYFYKYNCLLNIILYFSFLMIGVFLLVFLFFETHSLLAKTCICLFIFVMLLTEYLKNRFITNEKYLQRIRIIPSVIIILISTFVYNDAFSMSTHISKQFPLYDDVISQSENYFVSTISSLPYISSQLEESIYHECRHEDIALAIFKNELVTAERITRLPNEKAIAEIVHSKGSYNSDDIPYLSYPEALKKYHRYSSEVFEDCYYINHLVVARHKNIIVRIVVDDIQNIDKTLEKYIHGNGSMLK